MQRHDSEPLFGDDVYQLLRDDSLLLRTGSNNFAALIEPAEPPVSREQEQNDTGHFQQIPQQQQQQHMPLTQSTTSDQVLVVNNTENMFYQVSTSQQQQQSQGQQTSSGQREEQQQLEQIDIPWSTVDDNDAITLPTSHGQISQQEQFLLPMNNIYLPDTSTPPQRVPSLKPWPGRYEFAISIPTDNKDRNKWCFSELQKKLYMCPTVAVPVNVMLKEWVEASVIITPVFNDSRFRMEPVMRCYNCKSTQASEPELAEHIVQVEGEGCEYGIALERAIVTVPLQPPPPGETASTMLIKLMCLTSCVGGPNRRLFGLILTLKSNNTGEEIGRQVLNVKCCRCPSRDLANEDKAMQTLDDERVHTKVKKLATDLAVGVKRRRTNIKLEPGTGSQFVDVKVPSQFENKVKSYINVLILHEYAKTHPSMLMYPEAGEL